MKAALRCLAVVVFLQSAFGQSFEVAEASILDEQKAMSEGRVTSRALVQAYLNRIHAFDSHGPRLNALIALNPNAMKEAEGLDRERAAKGPRGPLHGIPVIVKDNYSTADMPTTAGTIALLGFVPSQDAFQVRKLREAGAVIIGKSNLHELASGITTISSAGGQTLNPYDPSRNPGGSSGGTGAAIAASFAAAGMGSDTCGSIRIPSSHNNLVGLRPTKGLSSIAGIVPLSSSQDVGGPLARTVADLAAMLDATVGQDPADPATLTRPDRTRPRFAEVLKTGSLRGARIGTLEPLFGDASDDQDVIRVVRASLEEMQKAGAVLVPVAMPELMAALEGTSLIDLEFAEDLADYLRQSGKPPVSSLAEIIDQGLIHLSLEASMRRRMASKGRAAEEYPRVLAKRASLVTAMLKVMDDQKLDALGYPTMRRRPARVGDGQPGTTCQLSASTGFPAISMQAGFTVDGLPVGVELFARPFDDARLVAMAYDYEHAAGHRKAPGLTPALGLRTSAPLISWQASGATAGTAGRVVAALVFDPATGDLKYELSTQGLAAGSVLSATLHRVTKGDVGPVVALVSNHPFDKLSGVERLSSVDREKLVSDGLYLRVAIRLGKAAIRIPLKPPVQR